MPIEPQTLIMFSLVAAAMGGVAWVFVYPYLSGEHRAETRRASIARNEPSARLAPARASQRSRREKVEESLKELELRRKKSKKVSLSARLTQAGLGWSKERFMITAGAFGVLAMIAAIVADAGWLATLAIGFAATFGLPIWVLIFLRKRREGKFLNAFPDAVDIIVRGIKSGLPLGDCLKIIATDTQEPVRSEFRGIVETQAIGMPMGDACAKLYERIPVTEANFFAIVIAIQQKAGGNLAEALGNLSRVLRDRKKMQAKIKAVSMEAKASAVIIAALPVAVMILVYLTSPEYIQLLWNTQLGRLMLACSAVWMFIGVLIMRKMINFDF
jgi:tight adherence protein B